MSKYFITQSYKTDAVGMTGWTPKYILTIQVYSVNSRAFRPRTPL